MTSFLSLIIMERTLTTRKSCQWSSYPVNIKTGICVYYLIDRERWWFLVGDCSSSMYDIAVLLVLKGIGCAGGGCGCCSGGNGGGDAFDEGGVGLSEHGAEFFPICVWRGAVSKRGSLRAKESGALDMFVRLSVDNHVQFGDFLSDVLGGIFSGGTTRDPPCEFLFRGFFGIPRGFRLFLNSGVCRFE